VLAGVVDEDLRVRVASNAQRVCNRAAERLASGWGQCFAESPLPPWPGIEPIRYRQELAIEGQQMRHCLGSWASCCLMGERFIYHVGEPAPHGSTVAVSQDGRRLEHRAARNRLPSVDDTAAVRSWLAHSAKARASTSIQSALEHPWNA
jgi:hypothetical protein